MKSEFLNVPELAQCCSLSDIVPPFQVCLKENCDLSQAVHCKVWSSEIGHYKFSNYFFNLKTPASVIS